MARCKSAEKSCKPEKSCKTDTKKTVKRCKLSQNEKIAKAEDKAMGNIYALFERIQKEVSYLEDDLTTLLKTDQKKLPSLVKEFGDLVWACRRFSDALTQFDQSIDKRRNS